VGSGEWLVLMAVLATGCGVSSGAFAQCGTVQQAEKIEGHDAPLTILGNAQRRTTVGVRRSNGINTMAVQEVNRVTVWECNANAANAAWTLAADLTAPAEAINFGEAIAISKTATGGGNGTYYMVIGAPETPIFANGSPDGAAYVYRNNGSGWTYQTRIDPPSLANAQFGASIAIGDRLAIADPSFSASGAVNDQLIGSVNVYALSGSNWVPNGVLQHPLDPAIYNRAYSQLGNRLVMDGLQIVASTFNAGISHYNYPSSTPSSAVPRSHDIELWEDFESYSLVDALAFDAQNNTLVIGMPSTQLNGTGGYQFGTSAVYTRTSSTSDWVFQSLLNPTIPLRQGQYFGSSIALLDDLNAGTPGVYRIAVGSTGAAGNAPGGATIFRKVGPLWIGDSFIDTRSTLPGDLQNQATNAVCGMGSWLGIGVDYFGEEGSPNSGGAFATFVASGGPDPLRSLQRNLCTDSRMGYSMASSGEWLVVGAPYEDTPQGLGAGTAYVYRKVGTEWVEQAPLIVTGAQSGDRSGASVAISGDFLVLGCPDDDFGNFPGESNAGSAVVFRLSSSNTWVFDQRIYSNDHAAGDNFGISVAMKTNQLMVGSVNDDNERGSNAGSAYDFEYSNNTWTQVRKLLADDGSANDQFGISVDFGSGAGLQFNNKYAVVGAYAADPQGSNSGAAYIFRLIPISGGPPVWDQIAKVIQPSGAAGDNFGYRVLFSAVTGALPNQSIERVIVSSMLDDTAAGVDAGSVHTFRSESSGWILEASLFANDAAAGEYFGSSLALNGLDLLIGAQRENNAGGSRAGAVYWHRRSSNTWPFQAKLLASDRLANDEFGTSVAISGTQFIIGSPLDDNTAGANAGSFYVFGSDLLAPVITQQPLSASTCSIGSVVLQLVTQSGGAQTYSWQFFNGTGWVAIANDGTTQTFGGFVTGRTTNRLTVYPQNMTSPTNFRCVITNACGTTTSSTATVTRNETTPPQVALQPIGLQMCSPATVTFTTQGSGDGPFTYQWLTAFWNGYEWGPTLLVTGESGTSFTRQPYFFPGTATAVSCRIRNSCGTVYTEWAYAVPDLVWTPVVSSIGRRFIDVSCWVDTLEVRPATPETMPYGGLSYQWRRQGVAIPGATNRSYEFPVPEPLDIVFDCVVTSSCRTLVAASFIVAESCIPPLTCDSIDFNNDSTFFDPQDIEAYLSVFAEGSCVPVTAVCGDIDFNNDDSAFDPCDIVSFITLFGEGPCTPCGL